MLKNKGVRFKIIINSLISVGIFTIMLSWFSYNYWESILEDRRDKLKDIAEIGYYIVEKYVKLEKDGVLTKQEAQENVKAIINNIRYSDNEYIFIADTTAHYILSPVKPELNGKDMSDFKDSHGFKAFVAFAETAKKNGEGYVSYIFPKIGSKVPSKKVSYIKLVPEWNWIVGTGLYLDYIGTSVSNFFKIIIISCIFVIVFLILIGLFYAKSIVDPLSLVCKSLLLSSKLIENKSKDLEKLCHTVKNSSEEQTKYVQSTAASITEVTNIIARTSQLTVQSAELINSISVKAQAGGVSVKKMVQSMKEIQEASSQLKNIENIILEIEQKTKVINDIVSKTELLSLNASIEAARAGESGKGFAVVAEEVGNLAKVSGKSSDDINVLLNKSREQVQNILSLTLAKVDEGQANTIESSEAFMTIAEGIDKINSQIAQISDETKQQEMGVKQISSAMIDLDKLSLVNNKNSEESLQATTEILNSSNELKDVSKKTEKVIFGENIAS